MAIVTLDTCGCVLNIGPDGEPDAFVGAPCALHQGADVSAPVSENRAKNAAVARAAEILGVDAGLVAWAFDDARAVSTLDADAKTVTTCAALTKADFVASVEATAAGVVIADAAAVGP